jgi:hypothetical protein
LIATFPEKRYGFLELPDEDAAKLKKKLNGAVVKGHKLKVDVAKPEKLPEPLGEAAMMAEEKASKKKDKGSVKDGKSKKRKREAEEIPGMELHEGRKVKRGWTVADEPKLRKDKKDKSKKGDKKEKRREVRSKYTDHPECLVKTIIPAKTVEEVDEDGKKKRKKSKAKQVLVHEFAKTTKFPTFLKTTASSSTDWKELEFVDGKGWVDDEGNVVEAVKTRPQPVKPASLPKVQRPQNAAASQEQPTATTQETDVPAESASKADGESDQEGFDNPRSEDEGDAETEQSADEGETKMKRSPAPDTPPNNAMSPPPKLTIAPPAVTDFDPPRPTSPSSNSAKGLSIKIPPATPGKNEVHPLEALYKRNKPTDGASATNGAEVEALPFSFFGGGDIDEDDTAGASLQIPMTPFSRADFENRGIRSAAPTPDTAHPNRSFKPWASEPDDIDEEDEGEDGESDAGPVDTDMHDDGEQDGAVTGGPPPGADESTSDFQKWFWEHRGDLNRSWKRRRKTAAKEKRYRENRARAERAI